MLAQKSISEVQRFAIQVMLHLESRSRAEAELRDVKLTLMATDPVEFAPELFPEYFAPVDLSDLDELPEGAEVEVVNSITDAEVDDMLAMMGVSRR